MIPSERVYLIQCLCGPERHCILAVPFVAEADQRSAQSKLWDAINGMKAAVQDAIEAKQLNPWCDLCGSRQWQYEAGRTPFPTLEEALPHLKQADQLATKRYLKASKN